MPSEGTLTNDRYEEVLDEIYALIEKYEEYTPIWIGDINGDVYRLRTSNDKKLRTFILEEDLVIIAPQSNIATS